MLKIKDNIFNENDINEIKNKLLVYYSKEALVDIILKAIEYMEHYIELEDAPINERIKIEFEEVIKILKGEENDKD